MLSWKGGKRDANHDSWCSSTKPQHPSMAECIRIDRFSMLPGFQSNASGKDDQSLVGAVILPHNMNPAFTALGGIHTIKEQHVLHPN